MATANETCLGTNTDEGEHTERFPLLSVGLCAITDTLTAQWWCQSLTATQMPCEKRKKEPSELKWLSLLSQSLALFLFPLLRGWNSVKHALVLTWDVYGNMFSYPRLLFCAKSFCWWAYSNRRERRNAKTCKILNVPEHCCFSTMMHESLKST